MKSFWDKIRKTPDCWIWEGAKTKGYGYIRYKGKNNLAHRVSYELNVSPIPEGLQIDHLCKNKSCVNPKHLEVVTVQVNQHRSDSFAGVNSQKEYCVAGHKFNRLNTYLRPDGKGRECRACRRIRASSLTQELA